MTKKKTQSKQVRGYRVQLEYWVHAGGIITVFDSNDETLYEANYMYSVTARDAYRQLTTVGAVLDLGMQTI